MPNVRRLRTGRWAMTYEICGPQDHCRSYVRTSDAPREWGPATSRDRVIRAVDGTEPRHTPTLLVDEDGSVLLGAQMHYRSEERRVGKGCRGGGGTRHKNRTSRRARDTERSARASKR